MTDIAIDPARIRERAHALWLARGCAAGSAERDWLDAEHAILAEEAAGRRPLVAVALPELPAASSPGARAVPARAVPARAVPPQSAQRSAHPKSEVPPRSATRARAGKGTKATPSSRAKRTG